MRKLLGNLLKNTAIAIATAVIVVSTVPANVYAETPGSPSSTTTTTETETHKEGEKAGSKTVTTTTTTTDTSTITDDDRAWADEALLNTVNSLKIQYDLKNSKKLDEIFNSAVYYIAYTDMSKAALETYVTEVKSTMTTVATNIASSVTTQYLQVADNWQTPMVSYGQSVSIVLPIINLGTEELNDIVIEPQVTNDVTKWPFVPDTTGYIQTEPYIPGYVNDDQAFNNRREFTYHFKVRDDVMTGFYELKFKVSFTRAGVRVEDDKASELSVYVHTVGKTGSGYIGGNGNEDKVAKPRIIITGYEVDKDKVFSGDTFNLTIHVKNTSKQTAVTNVLFNIAAAADYSGGGASTTSSSSSGSNSTTTVSSSYDSNVVPFMPTSGSNSIYMESIGQEQVADINIEMSAKPGLAQKSYSLGLNMTYDAGTQFDLTDSTNISIPVYQVAKYDLSTIEATPASINVGSQSNVMFSIYNTGKTTLYNVQVKFEADSIENNMAFVGNLGSGATGNVDIMLTGTSPSMDDGTINMIISYEDESGNVTEDARTCSLFVSEAMDENWGMREPDEPVEEEKDNAALVRGLIIAAVIVVIIAAAVTVYLLRKKKNETAAKEADLKDLEELEDIDNDSN